jgi:hypothetical protein
MNPSKAFLSSIFRNTQNTLGIMVTVLAFKHKGQWIESAIYL